MALSDLIFRCSVCGSDAVEGKGSRVYCRGCGAGFEADSRQRGILVRSQGSQHLVPAAQVAREIARWEGEDGGAGEGEELLVAEASIRKAVGQDPLNFNGDLLGFVERFGPSVQGALSLTTDALRFSPADGAPSSQWPLGEIKAVQASSSSIQITSGEGDVFSLRLANGSVRRWETRLCQAIRQYWLARGWGRIVEFQPRIQAR